MLDKDVRLWDVYVGLESIVKNLLTSLRAVNELQNSAVRERHWQQLMNTTKVAVPHCLILKDGSIESMRCGISYAVALS